MMTTEPIQEKKTYDLYPNYYRVSTVADAVGRTDSDGLMHVGATWSGQRAIQIARELLDGGISPDVARWELANPDVPILQYLASDSFQWAIKAGCTRLQQAAADRGTILNIVWDELNRCRKEGEKFTTNDAVDFAVQEIDLKNTLSKLAEEDYAIAIEAGLIDPKDDDARPERNYQCSQADVLPYVIVLSQWYPSAPWEPIASQGFVVNHEDQTMGTWDDYGKWGGEAGIWDLKSSTSKQPKLYNVCQLAKYLKEARKTRDSDIKGGNFLVTVDGVYPRLLSQKGYEVGNRNFDRALAILKEKSMAGLFVTTAQSKVKA